MKLKTLLIMVLLTTSLISCSVATSSYHYALGTQALRDGDLEAALQHLELSTQQCPTTLNYENLSFAYLQAGQVQKAWCAARQAILIMPTAVGVSNCNSIWEVIQKENSIDIGTSSLSYVSDVLGAPDNTIKEEDEKTILIYGSVALHFDDNILTEIKHDVADDNQSTAGEACMEVEISHDLPIKTTITMHFDDAKNWKDINRHLTQKQVIAEYIPVEQDVDHWTDLISLQRIDIKGSTDTMKHIVSTVESETLKKYPGSNTTFNVLKCGKSDALYEWKLHEAHKDIPEQHEVARLWFTNGYVYRIGVIKQYSHMNDIEREKWLGRLQHSTGLASYEDAMKHIANEISFANRSQECMDLARWNDWLAAKITEQNSCLIKLHIPPNTSAKNATEGLLVTSLLRGRHRTIEPYFAIERQSLTKQPGNLTHLQVLFESPTEVIYSYGHLQNGILRNVVVRSLLRNGDYFSIAYVQVVKTKATEEQLQDWKGWLEEIKIAG
ncbi:MAG: hypothetical protein Q8K75_06475 [Chlamydiales bacterium]|nr:hypothetical protein [Chlamydiales bacterium]